MSCLSSSDCFRYWFIFYDMFEYGLVSVIFYDMFEYGLVSVIFMICQSFNRRQENTIIGYLREQMKKLTLQLLQVTTNFSPCHYSSHITPMVEISQRTYIKTYVSSDDFLQFRQTNLNSLLPALFVHSIDLFLIYDEHKQLFADYLDKIYEFASDIAFQTLGDFRSQLLNMTTESFDKYTVEPNFSQFIKLAANRLLKGLKSRVTSVVLAELYSRTFTVPVYCISSNEVIKFDDLDKYIDFLPIHIQIQGRESILLKYPSFEYVDIVMNNRRPPRQAKSNQIEPCLICGKSYKNKMLYNCPKGCSVCYFCWDLSIYSKTIKKCPYCMSINADLSTAPPAKKTMFPIERPRQSVRYVANTSKPPEPQLEFHPKHVPGDPSHVEYGPSQCRICYNSYKEAQLFHCPNACPVCYSCWARHFYQSEDKDCPKCTTRIPESMLFKLEVTTNKYITQTSPTRNPVLCRNCSKETTLFSCRAECQCAGCAAYKITHHKETLTCRECYEPYDLDFLNEIYSEFETVRYNCRVCKTRRLHRFMYRNCLVCSTGLICVACARANPDLYNHLCVCRRKLVLTQSIVGSMPGHYGFTDCCREKRDGLVLCPAESPHVVHSDCVVGGKCPVCYSLLRI